jgi:hypothetical protein
MSTASSSSARRRLLVTWAAGSVFSFVLLAAISHSRTVPAAEQPTSSDRRSMPDPSGVRPFHVNVPDAELIELRRRIAATRWPDRETVNDRSQGVQKQEPFAAVLSCADSRVPVEILFDQTIGHVFVTRVGTSPPPRSS